MRTDIEFGHRALRFLVLVAAAAAGSMVSAQMVPDPLPPSSLPPLHIADAPKSVPDPAQLALFIRDKTAALKLGKALFWDMQVGSDGLTACATCHFHAGADSRSKNQVSPGLLGTVKDIAFSIQLGSAPNRQLVAEDFPLHKLTDANDRNSPVLRDTNDVISSQGVHYGLFVRADSGQPNDVVKPAHDPDGFAITSINVRRVEPRNTPTVINAVFNKVLFWDGRAKDTFNGVNVSGELNTLLYKSTNTGQLAPYSMDLKQSPLASLAVGPPLSMFEMSAANRPFVEIGDKLTRDKKMRKKYRILATEGRKLRGLRPLAKQVVHPEDSVLAAESRFPLAGLRTASYDDLIMQAFRPEWWYSRQMIQVDKDGKPGVLQGPAHKHDGNQYELKEWNFPLFFGLALQEYMATLVDGDSPFDRYHAGEIGALNGQQIEGLRLFVNAATPDAANAVTPGAGCTFCHAIPEFTTASIRLAALPASNQGFRNIGVRPIAEDPGRLDGPAPSAGQFKVPTLRNIELTAPYMHNGGMATLEQVVQFYSRGRSDFDVAHGGAPPGIVLGLSAEQQANLVAFLKALTSDRVRTQKGPFDHPQLFIPNGHPVNQNIVVNDGKGNATDSFLHVPPVGRNGGLSIAPNSFLPQ